ncbi:MAG TPA: phosphatase PAP2 family protein [Mycobacteriales bacterium]|jgi:undecaprenyl-diphosphatase|nr:phosphatase PAP2 family protein [Mycobacteriales bacterium]
MVNRLHDLDVEAYRRVQATNTPPWLDTGITALTHSADHSKLWLGAAALLATRGRPGRRAALRGLMSIGLASFVANVPAKYAVRRGRPDVLTLVRAGRVPHRIPKTRSFPSGHSASAAAFAVGAASEVPSLAVPLGVAAAAVGYSRVHTGVHYPGDVLAGWALGATVGVATRWWWPLAPVDPATVRERLAPTCTRPVPGGRGVTIAVNGSAGPDAATAEEVAAAIREVLPAADVVALDEPEQLAKTLEAAAPDAVAIGVRGGDGSVNAAAGVAYDAGRPLVVVPGGTLNHLARDLGLEGLDDVAAAVESGCTVDMDLAEIDGRPFLNTASFGSYADLVDARERLEDRVGKWPALVLALGRVLRRGGPVEAEIDGTPRKVWAIFVGNCRYEPAGFAPASRPRLDDGTLDVRIIDAERPLPALRLVLALLTGTLARSRVYEQRFATEVRVRVAEPIRLACDGETFDGSREFVIRKRPRPLRVYARAAD